uniref:SKICH domain-containing protein n=1 Tax=Rodentolepis nana TaxID=102285 RepID=A0A0R3TEM2_RODNA
LSLDYVSDSPHNEGLNQERIHVKNEGLNQERIPDQCNEIKARKRIPDITNELKARTKEKQWTVGLSNIDWIAPLMSLDYVPNTIAYQNTFTDWEYTLNSHVHLHRLGVYTQPTWTFDWEYTLNPHAPYVAWEYTLNPHALYVT